MAMDPTLNLTVIRSADLDRAEQFYNCLGLVFTRHSHGKGPEHLAFEGRGAVFEVYPEQDSTPSTLGVRIGFCVAELDSCIAELIGVGAGIISPPKDSPWGRRAVVKDPDGHKLELTEA